jgi:uncharacterized RDD family membrane protein YckC
MNCQFCGTGNDPEEHRCIQCGRRLDGFAILPTHGSTALEYARHAERRPEPDPPRQRELPLHLANPSRVVSISDYRTYAPPPEAQPAPQSPPRRQVRAEGLSGYSVGPQSRIDFEGIGAVVGPATAEPTRSRKVAVAEPMRRLIAGICDFGLVALVLAAIAFGLRGEVLVGEDARYFYGGLGAGLALLYKLLFVAADADSPGIRLCGLELVNFDGRQPSQGVRLYRAAWAVLSLIPAGLGLVWAFVDTKEHLTWHDQSTDTYLSPIR